MNGKLRAIVISLVLAVAVAAAGGAIASPTKAKGHASANIQIPSFKIPAWMINRKPAKPRTQIRHHTMQRSAASPAEPRIKHQTRHLSTASISIPMPRGPFVPPRGPIGHAFDLPNPEPEDLCADEGGLEDVYLGDEVENPDGSVDIVFGYKCRDSPPVYTERIPFKPAPEVKPPQWLPIPIFGTNQPADPADQGGSDDTSQEAEESAPEQPQVQPVPSGCDPGDWCTIFAKLGLLGTGGGGARILRKRRGR